MSEPAYHADLSIAETRGGHIKGRPISWVVVVLVSGGFLAAGVGLATAIAWLFIAGLAVVVLGGIVGWATHAMADSTARVERNAAKTGAAEPLRGGARQAAASTVDTPPSARSANDADRDSSEAPVG